MMKRDNTEKIENEEIRKLVAECFESKTEDTVTREEFEIFVKTVLGSIGISDRLLFTDSFGNVSVEIVEASGDSLGDEVEHYVLNVGDQRVEVEKDEEAEMGWSVDSRKL